MGFLSDVIPPLPPASFQLLEAGFLSGSAGFCSEVVDFGSSLTEVVDFGSSLHEGAFFNSPSGTSSELASLAGLSAEAAPARSFAGGKSTGSPNSSLPVGGVEER